MPPVARNPKTGEMVTWGGQSWRPLTDDEVGNLRPKRLLDEMGGSVRDRLTMKWFAANPATALAALRAQHPDWTVMPYGKGMNFAIQKPGEQEWRLLDPVKFGMKEALLDLADLLVGDIVLPAAGAALGAAGGPAGVAAGLAGAEVVRQGIGSAFGIPDNIDLNQAAFVGAAGGAFAGAGKYAGKAVRGVAGKVASGFSQRGMPEGQGLVSRATEQIAGKITKISPGQGMPIAEKILRRANMSTPPLSPAALVSQVQTHIDDVAESDIGNLLMQRDKLIPEGATVDLHRYRHALADLMDLATGERTFRWGESGVRREMQQELGALLAPPSKEAIERELGERATAGAVKASLLKATAAWEEGLRKVPATTALYAKNRIQDGARRGGAFGGLWSVTPGAAAPPDEAFIRNAANFSRDLNGHIKGQLNARVGELDTLVSKKVLARNNLRDLVGLDAGNPESFFSRLYQQGHDKAQKTLKAYDDAFDAIYSEHSRNTASGLAFTPVEAAAGEFGRPGVVPQLAASAGLPVGATSIASAGIGAGAGALLGGPASAAVGGVVGGVVGLAANPATITRMAPGAARAGAAVSRAAGRVAASRPSLLGRVATGAAGVVAGRAYGKHVADQDGKKKRKAYFLGG